MRFWYLFLLVLFFTQCGVKPDEEKSDEKIKLLILSGSNNHEWQKTTPQMVKMYEESGFFIKLRAALRLQ